MATDARILWRFDRGVAIPLVKAPPLPGIRGRAAGGGRSAMERVEPVARRVCQARLERAAARLRQCQEHAETLRARLENEIRGMLERPLCEFYAAERELAEVENADGTATPVGEPVEATSTGNAPPQFARAAGGATFPGERR